MNINDTVILSLVQGITEFLPISSSGHLVFLEKVLDLPVEKLKSFDVVVHIGTLLSILVYFWREVYMLICGFFNGITGKKSNDKMFNVSPMRFIWLLIVGTIPAVIIGLSLEKQIDGFFREGSNVGYSFIVSGLFFILAEFVAKKIKSGQLNSWRSLFVGVFQAIAIIPGISRSGSTIGAGLSVGLQRSDAARFSFLLGIPALLGAGILTALKFDASTTTGLTWQNYSLGFVLAFVSGYAAIYILMHFLKKHSLAWFSLYLIPLGLYLLISPQLT